MLKGLTLKQKPNTLNVGFATSGGPIAYNHYTPQYNQWIANNYGVTDHYGRLYLIHNQGFEFSNLTLDTWLTVEYKGKIVDPLVTLISNPSTNDDYPHNYHTYNATRHTTINNDPVDTNCVRASSTLKLQNDETLIDEVIDNSLIPGIPDTHTDDTIE